MSTILYIVVVIGVFVISAINKNKKKQEKLKQHQIINNSNQNNEYETLNKSEVSNKPEVSSNTRITNSLFEEFFQTSKDYQINKVEEVKKEEIVNETTKSKDEAEKVVENKVDITNVDEFDAEYNNDFIDNIDLEQAVIYSEILARKEY